MSLCNGPGYKSISGQLNCVKCNVERTLCDQPFTNSSTDSQDSQIPFCLAASTYNKSLMEEL